MQNFDDIWENILSEDEDQIKLAFRNLNIGEQEYILSHLQKMTTEEGWHPGQVASASFALNVISMEK